MNALEYICNRYGLDRYQKNLPIEIPDTTRDTLASIFADLGFTEGAEIGVERGLYSEVLCKNNPGLHLYSIDAWKAYRGYRDHVTQAKLDEIYRDAVLRLAPYNCTLIRKFSLDAVRTFADASLDFVFIDANHEIRQVIDDISEWQKKVRVGGIVAGHDYILRKGAGYIMHVPYAVRAWTEAYQIGPWFVLGRKNAPEGEVRETTRSWFYVKGEPVRIKLGHGS